jgi:hypothetical protein
MVARQRPEISKLTTAVGHKGETEMSDDSPAWQFFADLQTEADPRSIDRSLARDEALDVVLDEVVNDRLADKDLLQKRFSSLRRNRLSKLKNRRALEWHRFRSTHRRGGTDFGAVLLMAQARTVFEELVYNELTNLICTVLREEELKLLLEIAEGGNYTDVAHDRNMTVSGVKSKAFRIREKVRKSPISAALRDGLRR